MNISEKLTQIAQKEAENIELNNQLENLLSMEEEKSLYDEFWDAFQYNGERIDYVYAFHSWGAEYIRPKYKVIPKDGIVSHLASTNKQNAKYHNLVYNCPNVKKIEKEYFDLSQYYNESSYSSGSTFGNYYTFANNPNLEEIEDVGLQPYAYYGTFRWNPKLHTIEVIRSNENTTFDSSTFNTCFELKNIKIEGVIVSNINFQHSPKLSRESIISVIDHLSNDIGGTVTFTKNAVNTAFENGGENSDEWKNLTTPKIEKGWSFSLA